VKRLIVGVATAALLAGVAQAQSAPQGDPYYASPPGYYAPGADVGAAAPTADEATADVPPVYVEGRSGYGRHAWPGWTSPGADTSVRLRGLADPTTSVTAPPNPNNVSDQVPSRGPDLDGVPSYVPY
jgi:hypothetical protein